jgi:hypothetical protein
MRKITQDVKRTKMVSKIVMKPSTTQHSKVIMKDAWRTVPKIGTPGPLQHLGNSRHARQHETVFVGEVYQKPHV